LGSKYFLFGIDYVRIDGMMEGRISFLRWII
jgi:hypothetical protein